MTSQNTTNLGPLDWRIAIVDRSGRPTPEFIKRWGIQRTNNGLISNVKTAVGAPPATPSPADGATYIDTSVTPYILYVGEGGTWNQVGPVIFTDLNDVPHSYKNSASQLVQVNSKADGLQFTTISEVLDEVDTGPASGDLLQRNASVWVFTPIEAILDAIGAVQGSILYRSAIGWVALPPGTSGQVLTSQGAGMNPIWM